MGIAAIGQLLLFGLIPTIILIAGGIYALVKTGLVPGGVILGGAVLVFLSSLQFIYNIVVSLYFGPEMLAEHAIYGGFIFGGFHGVGLLLLGIGLALLVDQID